MLFCLDRTIEPCRDKIIRTQTRSLRIPYSGQRWRKHAPSNTSLLIKISGVQDWTFDGTTRLERTRIAETNRNRWNLQGPLLPQSPLTDSRFNAARFGHKHTKSQPQTSTHFQSELRKNPYGTVKVLSSTGTTR